MNDNLRVFGMWCFLWGGFFLKMVVIGGKIVGKKELVYFFEIFWGKVYIRMFFFFLLFWFVYCVYIYLIL